mmetsp:Transcript_23001/g.39505  ORF Transcript_23001/g.39505 Transcript_23001/m.39505 type:complete len:298 (+) Transcript_23001:194-1087(+)
MCTTNDFFVQADGSLGLGLVQDKPRRWFSVCFVVNTLTAREAPEILTDRLLYVYTYKSIYLYIYLSIYIISLFLFSLFALGMDHVGRDDDLVELLRGEEAESQSCLFQRDVLLVGLLGYLGGLVVADLGVEGGDEHEGVVEVLLDGAEVGLDAVHAVDLEHVASVREQVARVDEVVDDQRLENVELEVALHASAGDGAVVADHLAANHRHRLRLGRVHLPGHDRAPRLVGREGNLADHAPRPRAEQPYVIGDLHQRHREGLEGAGGLDEGVVGREGGELVRGGDEREGGDVGDVLGG